VKDAYELKEDIAITPLSMRKNEKSPGKWKEIKEETKEDVGDKFRSRSN